MSSRDSLLTQSIDIIDSINKWSSGKSFKFSLDSGDDVQVNTFKTIVNGKPWFARTSTIPHKYQHKLIKCITGISTPGKTHSDYEKEYINEITSVECTNICEFSEGWNYQLTVDYDFGIFTQKRVFYEIVNVYQGDGFVYVISSAVPGPKTNSVIGTYDSIEKISWSGDQLVWTMATTSNPGGLIPSWLTNLTIPNAIAKDVPRVLNWVNIQSNFST